MGRNRKRAMIPAVLGIVILGGLSLGFALKKEGARGGREYIEEGHVVLAKAATTETAITETSAAETKTSEIKTTETTDAVSLAGTSIQPGISAEESKEQKDGQEISEEGKENSSDIVMLFAGDVYLSNHVLSAYDRAGGIQGVLDEGIRREIETADIFMVNQEFPFTVRGTAAEDKQFTFRVPESRMHIMQEMGIDIVTLANNHILDFGPEGLTDSCKALDEAGILYVGGGEDLERAGALKTVTIGQKIIGFLGTSRVYMAASWAAGNGHPGVFSTYDTTLPLKAIREAKEECDYLVVYVHWGVEREEIPKDYQRAMGRAYIDAGADLVVGSHPHVLQPVEEYNGKTIVYSLGNFVFGSSIPKTALLKVTWGEEGTEVSMIPCTSSGGYTRLAE